MFDVHCDHWFCLGLCNQVTKRGLTVRGADAHPCALMNRAMPAVVVGKSGGSCQQGRVGAAHTGRWAAYRAHII